MNHNTELIYKSNKDMNFYKNKINILNKYIDKLTFERNKLTQKNTKMKNNLNNYLHNNYEAYKNKQNEIRLENQNKK